MPAVFVRRLPPSQRPLRPARTTPQHWAISNAASKHTAKKKKLPVPALAKSPTRGQKRTEDEPRDMVALRLTLMLGDLEVVGSIPSSALK